MVRRSWPAGLLALVAFGAGALGCSRGGRMPANDAGVTRDGSRDVPGNDGGPALDAARDAAPAVSVLHVSVTGCATFDPANEICTGSAPLTLTFAPVGSAALDTFRWMFGDSPQASMETAPTHTYALPGSYAVSVNGGSLADRNYTVAGVGCQVSVLPLAAGAACDVDRQCAAGLQCFCKAGSGCGPAFARGVCSTSCTTGFCGTGAVCAEVALGATGADGGAAAPVCLADCSSSGKCAAGFACQQIPGGGGTSAAWVSACLPLGAANDFGASCRDSNGALDDSACTTGHCADLGALGMCTSACTGGQDCPPGAACATISGTATGLCLPACSATFPCTGDPALQCTSAGADGGPTIGGGTPGASYCAPR